MALTKKPLNGWRIAALVAVPMFFYCVWKYAESEAKYRHLLEHTQEHTEHGH